MSVLLPSFLSANYRAASPSDLIVDISDVVAGTSALAPEMCPRELPHIASLLESAYGYRNLDGRRTRAAASAGARYPTEILLLGTRPDGLTQVIYDFELGTFQQAKIMAETPELVELVETHPGGWLVVGLSLVWRSVSRYKTRGFQYSIVDGYNVLGNINEVAFDLGYPAGFVSNKDVNCLKTLDRYNGVLFPLGAVWLQLPQDLKENHAATRSGQSERSLFEHIPRFSPEMVRVDTLYKDHYLKSNVDLAKIKSPSRQLRKPVQWTQQRRSLRQSGGGLPADRIGTVFSVLRKYFEVFEHALSGRFYGAFEINRDDFAPEAHDLGDRITHRPGLVVSCFDKQPWLEKSACLIVMVSVNLNDQDNAVRRLFEGSIVSSLMLADIERDLMRHDISGTTIGGFSMSAAQSFLGESGVVPIIAYAFGSGDSAGQKTDADA